jgi:hypothetical protein
MIHHKDTIAPNIKVINKRDATIINNDDEDSVFAPFTVEGGAYLKKGVVLGIQEKMISGLLLYDNENFYGFSDKHGLSLLSPHMEYNELEIPQSVFLSEQPNILQPKLTSSQNNDFFQNENDLNKINNKNLNIDLQIKDTYNFYITIPESYTQSKFALTFDITYIYDLNSIISNLTLVFINKSSKNAFFKIKNDNCYYMTDFDNEINKDSINKINLEIVNEDCFLINKLKFHK